MMNGRVQTMIRIAASLILGCILLFVQGYIVMLINDYHSIQFNYAPGVLAVWLLNCTLSFSLVNQMKPWLEKQLGTESES